MLRFTSQPVAVSLPGPPLQNVMAWTSSEMVRPPGSSPVHYLGTINALQVERDRMAVVITLSPKTDRGDEVLDELERRTGMQSERLDDGTRRYYLEDDKADPDAFDPTLNEIRPDWHQHVERWRIG
jgi:hypothetical protein